MEFVISFSTLLSAGLAFIVGIFLMYVIINKKDETAMSILRACEFLMDEFGEDIMSKDKALYAELMDTLEELRGIVVDGTTIWEFFSLMRKIPGIFKTLTDVYDVDEWVKKALKKVE